MNTTDVISATKGQLVCRPTGWLDVLKFFLLNYGLHAITIVSTPGGGRIVMVTHTVAAILLPFSGTLKAIGVIYRFARLEKHPLLIAHKAGALCAVVPAGIKPKHGISTSLTSVHGHHPIPVPGTLDIFKQLWSPKSTARPPWILARVPLKCEVAELKVPRASAHVELSCNYSILKPVAALIQILYGSYELYEAGVRQIPRFGYAAYSLTVIPYIIMSMINLLASFCEPQYPTMFLVKYDGPSVEYETRAGSVEDVPKQESKFPGYSTVKSLHETPTDEEVGVEVQERDYDIEHETRANSAAAIQEQESKSPSEVTETTRQAPAGGAVGDKPVIHGEVGVAKGSVSDSNGDIVQHVLGSAHKRNKAGWAIAAVSALLAVCSLAAPYIIIALLTGFKKGQSTRSQRSWTMVWLVFGQYSGFVAYPTISGSQGNDSVKRKAVAFFNILIWGVGALGGFVVIAQMMLVDEVCTRI